LDTLNELAAALGDDANFSTTVTNSIATKMPLAGGTFTGNVSVISGTSSDLQIIGDGDGWPSLRIKRQNGVSKTNQSYYWRIFSGGELALVDETNSNANRFLVDSGGDVSFYNTSGNERFYWDASAESLGIGTATPNANADLHIHNTSGTALWLTSGGNNPAEAGFIRMSEQFDGSGAYFELKHNGSVNTLALNSSNTGGSVQTWERTTGNIGFSTDTPSARVDINANGTGGTVGLHVNKDDTTGYFARFEADLGTNNNRTLTLAPPSTDSGDDPFVWNTGNSMAFQIDGNTKLQLTSGGTVQIDSKTVHNGTLDIEEVYEKVVVSPNTSGTVNFDTTLQGVVFFSVDQLANRTINFSNVNANLDAGQSVTCSILMAQGSTAYYLNAYQVDGSTVTPKWSGGSAPTEGNASGIDVYTFTIIKTANATFTVLASQSQYA
jgi:hypothetical protein